MNLIGIDGHLHQAFQSVGFQKLIGQLWVVLCIVFVGWLRRAKKNWVSWVRSTREGSTGWMDHQDTHTDKCWHTDAQKCVIQFDDKLTWKICLSEKSVRLSSAPWESSNFPVQRGGESTSGALVRLARVSNYYFSLNINILQAELAIRRRRQRRQLRLRRTFRRYVVHCCLLYARIVFGGVDGALK